MKKKNGFRLLSFPPKKKNLCFLHTTQAQIRVARYNPFNGHHTHTHLHPHFLHSPRTCPFFILVSLRPSFTQRSLPSAIWPALVCFSFACVWGVHGSGQYPIGPGEQPMSRINNSHNYSISQDLAAVGRGVFFFWFWVRSVGPISTDPGSGTQQKENRYCSRCSFYFRMITIASSSPLNMSPVFLAYCLVLTGIVLDPLNRPSPNSSGTSSISYEHTTIKK